MIIKDDKSVWGCGGNGDGEIGLGNYVRAKCICKIYINIRRFLSFLCWVCTTMVIKSDGSLFGSGKGANGLLSTGDDLSRSIFEQIPGTTKVIDVAANRQQTMIIKEDGTVWGCGRNQAGEIGNNSTSVQRTLVQATTTGSDAITIVAADGHSLIIKSPGDVFGTGYNGNGSLGNGNQTDKHVFSSSGGKVAMNDGQGLNIWYDNYWVTPTSALTTAPTETYPTFYRATSSTVIQNAGDNDFRGLKNITVTQEKKDLIDSSNTSLTDKIYLDNTKNYSYSWRYDVGRFRSI